MNFTEFRDMEDELLSTSCFSMVPPRYGARVILDDVEYEVIDSFLKNTKRSYWWSFGFKFDAFKMVVIVDTVD